MLVAGPHTVPLVYATLSVFNEALRVMHEKTGDDKYLVPRRRRAHDDLGRPAGLPQPRRPARPRGDGGEEPLREVQTTGPSGHGAPPAAGEAMALKHAGAKGVKVFGIEGGRRPHRRPAGTRPRTAPYGLGLDNLHMILD